MTHFRLYVKKNPRHTHVRVFVADQEQLTHANAGSLCLHHDQWDALLDVLRPSILGPPYLIELVDETEEG